MKKIVGITVVILTLIILIISSIDDVTKSIADLRYESKGWWGSDKYIYGDLYGFSYLPHFRMKDQKGKRNFITFQTPQQFKDIDIYAMCDSYTGELFSEPSLFYHVDKTQFAVLSNRQTVPAKLDPHKRNILVLETSERNVRPVYKDTAYLTHFLDFNSGEQNNDQAGGAKPAKKIKLKFKLKDIDPNIEFNIWDYRFLTPFKELKAQVSYSMFNRVNHDVYVSDDQKYLLFAKTIDTVNLESAFKPIGKPELNDIINTMNRAYDYYKSKGFDEVYIAIIPNPVTILYPHYKGNTYNELIPLIQNNKALKCKVIDAYTPFKSSKAHLYSYSDTHWTFDGEKVWLSLLNKELRAGEKFQK
ncbi:hypothetical protein [Mucilaginibacter jinjuensis]|uniref:Acetyltransferase AlgX (SGNH hydrolase-like protein) n=1 Tax=Mucilaginibacter jinjuensis TaxID=1176721 RepID=A0ABY7TCL9_9SPHI|nr:hypothetical protein [Mucilaginibacter jinjuensis]WCT12952.1 hypothetical protein PQO05_03265 [Mucilaginibacter jinjuensis]